MLWAFGACTSMTMRMYARGNGWDYGTTQVTLRHERIHAHDRASCVTEDGYVDRLHREIPTRPGTSTRAASRAAGHLRISAPSTAP